MLVTITEFKNSKQGPNGQSWQLGDPDQVVAVQSETAATTVTLNATTRLIRVATDTAITLNLHGTPQLLMPGVEWFAISGGEAQDVAIATVA